MTDEEKAEITKEYLKNTFKQTEENQPAIMIGCKCFYEGLEKGLEEGRKELEQWKQEWQDAQIKANEEGFARTILLIKCSELQKENAELNRDKTELVNSVTELENKVTELEKENAEILEDNDTLNKWIDELKAQIEEMKCCENCKHSYTDSENIVFCYLPLPQESCKSCKLYNHKNTDNDYWECIE